MSLCFLSQKMDFTDEWSADATPIYKKSKLVRIMINMFKDNRHQYMEFVPVDIFTEWSKLGEDALKEKIDSYHELKKLSEV